MSGLWKLAGDTLSDVSVTYEGDDTAIIFRTREALTEEITLSMAESD